ncbi:hypothetical protein AB6A40_002806 [Gnathostoma spinigerum]|uniref:peptidylprolyl isomerase n=1 Tax=Gnathostoma spinigerum TaxID=75299 RepID=A0ABD6EHD9_9BILA
MTYVASSEDKLCDEVMCDSPDEGAVFSQRRAVSSGEPSLDGSVDEERAALSDSDISNALRTQVLAVQAKGPSSDALEVECRTADLKATQESEGNESSIKNSEEWEDVVGSGSLFRKIVCVGKGRKPRNGERIAIRVVDRTLGIDSHDEIEFLLGFSMVIDAWEMVAQLMREGEVNHVKTDARFAYGSFGDKERGITPHQAMEYSIELLAIKGAPIYTNMPREEFIAAICEFKERGNYYYGRNEFEKAIFVYKRSLNLVEIPRDDETLCNIFSVIHSNIAVCYAKLCDWKSTLESADESLKLNPNNTKALFRRANAYENLNCIEESIGTLKQAQLIDPGDQLVLKELHRLKARRRLHLEQERSLYKRMLAGASDENDYRKKRSMSPSMRYALLAFFTVVFALFIHFLRLMLTKTPEVA